MCRRAVLAFPYSLLFSYGFDIVCQVDRRGYNIDTYLVDIDAERESFNFTPVREFLRVTTANGTVYDYDDIDTN